MKNILTAIDFSEMAERVVRAAAHLAQGRNAHLWLVHVAAPDPSFVGYEAGPDHVRDNRAKTLHREHRTLQESAQWLRDAGLDVTPLLIQGPTAETLLDQAHRHQADVIVMGSHGHSALHDLVAGSVAQTILRQASCPVLVVPPKRGAENPSR